MQEESFNEEDANKGRGDKKKGSNNIKSKTLLENICNYKFIAVTYFLSDILSLTTNLCKIFQRDDICLYEFGDHMDSTIEVLTNDYINNTIYGSHYSKFLSNYNSETFLPHIHVLTTEQLKQETQEFTSHFSKYLKENLHARFGEEEICMRFRVVDIEGIRKLEDAQVPAYGLTEIDWLGEFYGYERVNKTSQIFKPVVDSQRLRNEWQIFKTYVRRLSLPPEALNGHLFEENRISPEGEQMYANILKMSVICSIMPLSSACCERGFSALNLIKSEIRSNLGKHINTVLLFRIEYLCLGEEALEWAMRIHIDGPPLKEYDFSSTYLEWRALKDRRLVAS
jgi:hypothetical protein